MMAWSGMTYLHLMKLQSMIKHAWPLQPYWHIAGVHEEGSHGQAHREENCCDYSC